MQEERALKADDGRAKLYADIAHPINSDCRDAIQRKVLEAHSAEMERSKLPGYVCTYDDYGEESFAALNEDLVLELPAVMPFAEGVRRRDHVAMAGGPHVRPFHGNGDSTAVAVLHAGNDENFGDGII